MKDEEKRRKISNGSATLTTSFEWFDKLIPTDRDSATPSTRFRQAQSKAQGRPLDYARGKLLLTTSGEFERTVGSRKKEVESRK